MNDPRHPARRRDYTMRRLIDQILNSSAAKVDKRAALLTLGLSIGRTLEVTK